MAENAKADSGFRNIGFNDYLSQLQALRARAAVPVVAGFGIKDAASAAAMARQADGVVVGSALVATLADAGSVDEACTRARAFLAPLRAALDG